MTTETCQLALTESEAPEETNGSNVLDMLAAWHTVVGARETNQDAVVVVQAAACTRDRLILEALADGMGGHKSGATAAALAVETCVSHITGCAVACTQRGCFLDPRICLEEAFALANDRVIAYPKAHPGHEGMGTTLVAVLVLGTRFYVASVGDSRCYLGRGNDVRQLTHDDSYVQALVDHNILTRDQALTHPRAHELIRALGGPKDVDGLTVFAQDLEPGDVILLCSDGLWKVGDDLIRDACLHLPNQAFAQSNLDDTLRALIEQALDRGTDDNVSVAVLWVSAGDQESGDAGATPCESTTAREATED